MSSSRWKSSALASALLLSLVHQSRVNAQTAAVMPRAETEPVPSGGDAADDSAIWVHPTHPGLSVVIGTDKQSGIAVYDLDGNQRQFVPAGNTNNVDLRYGFPLAGTSTALVTSAERGQNVLAIYALFQPTRTLHDVVARSIPLVDEVYGCCMYRSAVDGKYYFFATNKDGLVEQWHLFDNGQGRVDAALVRSLDIGGQSEGCVADDENGWFFVSEEEVGIWRYGAEPGAGSARVLVDSTSAGGQLAADVEGLSIYYAPNGAGYLIASSQGNNRFVVYDRAAPHAHRSTFEATANAALGVDEVSDTDGVDLTNLALGQRWPGGLLVVQDGSNPGGNQNFKLLDWRDIAAAANPPLIVDTSYDAFGAHCPKASSSVRLGSGANPLTLTSPDRPALGSSFRIDLDCSGHAPGKAVLNAFSRPASGIFGLAGEVLVDRTSGQLARLTRLHAGGSAHFQIAIPPDVGLCGVAVFSQGTCFGASGPQYSNALDVVLGW